MTSLKDIAKSCNVSIATVSKALNDHDDISEETKAFIREVADNLGYFPNNTARALKTNRTYNLGVICYDIGIGHEYFSKVLESFVFAADTGGYSVTFVGDHLGKDKTTYYEQCVYKGFDGVCIINADFISPEIHELAVSALPMVAIDYEFNNRTGVMSDNIEGMRALVENVCGLGHRKLAFIHGSRTAVTEKRLIGFYRACRDFGVDVSDEYVREGYFHNPAASGKLTKEMLALKERPTCIFYPDDFSCIGGMNAIYDAGLSIPGDISIVGYDGIFISQVLRPRLTTYKQDTDTLGRMAANQLIKAIEHPKTALRENTFVKGELLPGETVSAVNQ